jgi:SnoaL-like domain
VTRVSTVSTATDLGSAFVASLVAHDFDRIEKMLAAGIAFRKLTPGGFAEASGPEGALEWLRRFHGDTEEAELVTSRVEPVPGKLQIEYTIRGVEDGKREVSRQTVYAVVEDGQITAMDVLCTGRHPA